MRMHHPRTPGLRPPPPPRGRHGRQPLRDKPITAWNRFPLPKNAGERTILAVLRSIYKEQWIQNVSMEDGKLLRILAESIGAKRVVEIGASNGCSALWFCLALRASGGTMTSYEADPQRAILARENFRRAGVSGIVTFIEGNAHREIRHLRSGIDLVFLDADREGNQDYLSELLPKVRPGGLIVSHNMSAPPMGISPPPDPRYVRAITGSTSLETLFLGMHDSGVAVTLKKR